MIPRSPTRSLARSCRPVLVPFPCSAGPHQPSVPPKHGYCVEQQP